MSMEVLSEPVVVDILSRLPVKTIVHCKCVCKKWRDLISDSYFVNLHMSRSPTSLIIHDYFGNETIGDIWKCVEVEDELDHHHLHHGPIMSLDLDPIARGQDLQVQGSVNGLICLGAWQHGFDNDNTYICNPITREYMILSVQQINREYAYCFGVGSFSQEYKLIQICLCTLEVEVYTLGTGRWRSAGRAPYLFRKLVGTFLNGHAHWIVDNGQDSREKLCAFNFDEETFKLFPSPPSDAHVGESFDKSLGVLKGCLCLCDSNLFDDKLKVWVMKEYGINNSWHIESVIRCSMLYDLDLSLVGIYIIEGLKDGTILMGCYEKALFVYCPRRNIIIVDPDIVKGYFEGFSYRPSFHRLRNFENETIHVF